MENRNLFEEFLNELDATKKMENETVEEEPCDFTTQNICGRCYAETDKLFPANCFEKPELLAGQPLGQYHCPDCGAMVLAGVPHPDLCLECLERKHPGFDAKLK